MKSVLLIGLGRFGRHIAMKLNEMRHQVMAVDKNEKRVNAVLPLSLIHILTTEYVPIKKSSRSKTATLARRLYFDSYYSFVMTDFFEGLHYGHYPRRCGICKKYFLMTSAARQKYCTGYAPFKLKGKAITCRKYAARINRKELAAGNPVIRIYKNRCSVLRMERKRGTVTEEFAATALDLAKERMQRAKEDTEYANSQYESDMSREKLYAEVDKQLK